MLGKLNAHSTVGVTGNHGLQEIDTAKEQWIEDTKLWAEFTGRGRYQVGLMTIPDVYVSCDSFAARIDQDYLDSAFVPEDIFQIGQRDRETIDYREPAIQSVLIEIDDSGTVIEALYIRSGWKPYPKKLT